MNGSSSLAEEVRRLSGPDPLGWLRGAAFDWGLIALAMVLAHASGTWLAWIPAALVIGPRQNGLGLLGHEAAHGLVLCSKRWNDTLANMVVFWPLTGSLEGYRAFHVRHHAYLGTARDPERELHVSHYWQTAPSRGHLWGTLARDVIGLGLGELLRTLRWLRPSHRADCFPLAGFWALLLTLWTTCQLPWAPLGIWFLCLPTTFFASFRFREYFEHTFATEGTHRFSVPLWARLFLFPHHTYCHYEHHAHPGVPMSRLTRLRAAIDGDGKGGRPAVVPLRDLLVRPVRPGRAAGRE